MSNIMANSSIWGKTGTDDAPTAGKTDRLASDKHTFLKLLVAQLTNQDPLNPTDDKEFVAQLAQFTSLEQLQEINAGMGTLNTTMNQGQMMTATGFIGKDVVVTGDQVTKLNDAEGGIVTTRVYYTVEEPFAKGQVNIYDGNGNPVFSDTLPPKQAGTYDYPWQGRDSAGKEVPSGVYSIIITTQDASDKAVITKTMFSARVVGVMNEDGVYKLGLDGGRIVPISDVIQVENAATSSGSATVGEVTRAADGAAAASLAADAAAAADEAIVGGETSAADAKKLAKQAITAANNAQTAARAAETAAETARKNAEELKTADALKDAKEAKEWAEKARAFADAAKVSEESAKAKAKALDPDVDFSK